MISYLLIILLVIIILSETYALRVMYKKNSKLEEMANDDLTILEGIKDFMQAALDRILQLDVNHIFEGDDDVGYFYQILELEHYPPYLLINPICSCLNGFQNIFLM